MPAAAFHPSDETRRPLPGLEGHSTAILLLVLGLCAALPYANTLLNGFIYDDLQQLVDNPYVQTFAHTGEIFTTTVWSFQGVQGITNYYRPLMTFAYLIGYQLFGPLAYIYHLMNLLSHVSVVLVLFALTLRMFRDRLLAFLAALLFALHPVHVESVAWIAGLPDLQLAFFFLLAMWLYIGIERLGGPDSWRSQLALAGTFLLALLSKEPAATFPVLAAAYEHCCREDRRETTFLQKLARYRYLWLLLLAYILFRVKVFGAFAPVLQRPNLTWYEAFLSGAALVGQYARDLFWPQPLSSFYVFRKSTSFADPAVLAGLGVLAAGTTLFLILWRRQRNLCFALAWMLLTLAPVLNARWMAANVFAERYLYLPSVAFCWLLAAGWVALWRGAPLSETETAREMRGTRPAVRWTLAAVLLGVCALSAVSIVRQNRLWENEVVFFSKILEGSPEAYLVRTSLGTVYWNRGDLAAAEREWQRALRQVSTNAIALQNMGLLRTQQKRYDEAVDYFHKAIRYKPRYAIPHFNLAKLYEELGRDQQAEIEYRVALDLYPLHLDARNHLAQSYHRAGRIAEAEQQFLISVRNRPNDGGYTGLGQIRLARRQYAEAQAAFQQAVELNPFNSDARFGLAEVLTAEGRYAEAMREYEEGLTIDPQNVRAQEAVKQLRAQVPAGASSRP